MIAYVKSYDCGIRWMYFLIEDDVLLKKYNYIWNKVSNSMNTISNKKLLKTKIKS